jgi:uncharacterized coiled-coil protein SlyX
MNAIDPRLNMMLMAAEQEASDFRDQLITELRARIASETERRLAAEANQGQGSAAAPDLTGVEGRISSLSETLSGLQQQLAELASSIAQLRDQPPTTVERVIEREVPAPTDGQDPRAEVKLGEMVFNVRRDMEGRIQQVVLQE